MTIDPNLARRIQDLPPATTPLSGAELVPISQNGVTVKTTAVSLAGSGGLPSGSAYEVLQLSSDGVTPVWGAPTGVQSVSTSTTVTNSNPENVIAVNTGSTVTVTLPASPITGEVFIVKDATGGAATNNITISGNGANIDGASAQTIGIDYGSAKVVFSGSIWLSI
jgi:hypothetical protein